MKRQRVLAHQRRLPLDTILLVARYILNPRTFFALLEGIRSTFSDLGIFEPIWLLSQTSNHQDLWPYLRLNRAPTINEKRYIIDALSLYQFVEVVVPISVLWLPRNTNVHVHLIGLNGQEEALKKFLEGLNELLVVELTLSDTQFDAMQHLILKWNHLKNLKIQMDGLGRELDLAAVLRCLPGSNINRLLLQCSKYYNHSHPISPAMLSDLVAWLQCRQVYELEFCFWDFRPVVTDMNIFYDALTNCSTLERLCISHTPLLSLGGYTFMKPLPMDEIELNDCSLLPHDMKHLCSGINSSKVSSLSLAQNPSFGIDGMNALAESMGRAPCFRLLSLQNIWITLGEGQILCRGIRSSTVESIVLNDIYSQGHVMEKLISWLPTAGIKQLAYHGDSFGDTICRALADSLAETKLTSLNLSHNNITDNGANALARLLQHDTLSSLVLDGNRISLAGAATLVNAFGQPTLDRNLSIRDSDIQLVNIVRFNQSRQQSPLRRPIRVCQPNPHLRSIYPCARQLNPCI